MSQASGWRVAAVVGLIGVGMSGCGFGGLNSVVLPGAVGTGDDGYDVVVELETAANLVPNSEVKVDDVTVGTVRSIRLDGWNVKVEISVENHVRLTSDVRARIAQKSLLGAEYLELEMPEESSGSQLRDGDTVPLAQTGRYPETEEVLSALSTVLNGGGLSNVGVIVEELNHLVDKRSSARQLITDLGSLLAGLRRQREGIAASIEAVDRLAVGLRRESDTIGTAVDRLAPGIAVLARRQQDLTTALAAVDRLSQVGARVIDSAAEDLTSDVKDLRSIAAALEKSGDGLTGALDLVGTILFPVSVVGNVVKGDYLSVAVTLDVSVPTLMRDLIPSGIGQHGTTLLQSLLTTAALTPPIPLLSGSAPPPSSSATPRDPETAGPTTEPGERPSSGPESLGELLDMLLGGSR